MSTKVECPACHSYTSGVFLAAVNDRPCPHCGAHIVSGEKSDSAATLTEFLLARIAEDEAAAKAALDPQRPGTHWQWETTERDRVVESPTWEDGPVSLRTVEQFPTTSGVGDLPAFVLGFVEVDEPRALPHIARHDPARVLAECEAKRRIVEEHELVYPSPSAETWGHDGECGTCCSWPCPTLRLLALPYADHPDYREEWKP